MTTKRIKMLKSETGRYPGLGTGSYHCRTGEEYDVPVKLADAWITKGIAEMASSVSAPRSQAGLFSRKPEPEPKPDSNDDPDSEE